MSLQYISKKTSRLYKHPTGASYNQILIFGEEVRIEGNVINGRVKAIYRNKYEGYIKIAHLKEQASLEVYFIDVGQGDAAFIITPERKKILIDGGSNSQARGFLSWKFQLANENAPNLVIDLLVLTHADSDHLKGLIPILEHDKIEVRQIIHNGIGLFLGMDEKSGNLSTNKKHLITYHNKLSELINLPLRRTFKRWIELIGRLNIPYRAVSNQTSNFNIGDSTVNIEILGPILEKDSNNFTQLKWFGNHSHTINGHSVMLRLIYGEIKILFSGDINIEGSEYLMEHPQSTLQLRAHVFKSPHHGSHQFHYPLLEAVRPQISIISSGDSPDHGHPRANFIGAVGLASRSKNPLVFSTEIAATFVDANEIDITNVIPRSVIRPTDLKKARIFKKILHGMINIRTDGKALYAMRRVNASYWWESYGPLTPADYPSIF
ncbi:ComEC/Rec2 family competence protein [Arenibacter latericius]|uniref:ComEC/Rec2 family competence protein n=1 Tax=Arenibacter latericius TaxID=86104 RepID=UPI0003F706CF|nr:MBL fold metallo-hydrolase [Arenibacter latericius]MDX1364789.1 MBL fold metallo-hydrolase [Arenibacter latericius]